jgi:hypothetical protein
MDDFFAAVENTTNIFGAFNDICLQYTYLKIILGYYHFIRIITVFAVFVENYCEYTVLFIYYKFLTVLSVEYIKAFFYSSVKTC